MVSTIPANLLLKLLLQVFDVVDVEVSVESQAVDEVFVADSPHHGNYIYVIAAVFYFKVVSDERVVLKASSDQLLIGADIKAKGLTVVIFALEGKRHLDSLQIEKSYVAIVARCNQEKNSLLAAWPPRSRGLERISTASTLGVWEHGTFLAWATRRGALSRCLLLSLIEDLILLVVALDEPLLTEVLLHVALGFIFLG